MRPKKMTIPKRSPASLAADRIVAGGLIDEAKAKWTNVNEVPEVIAARAKMDEAERAGRAAREAFNRVFYAHAPKGAEMRIAKQFPGLLVIGGPDLDDDFKWVARCSVTRLPIFVGDLVYILGEDKEDYKRTYILAEYVDLKGSDAKPVIVNEDGVSG